MNYLDIGILVILIMGVISGARKGFLISILNVLGLIVSIVLSFTLTKTFAGLIYKYSNIPNYISDMVSQRMTSLDSFTQIIINKIKASGMGPQEFLTAGFVNVATFIVLFIVTTIIISIMKQGIRKSLRKSFFGPIDSILGGVLGFVKWIIILLVALIFITPILPLISKTNQFYILIEGSYIAKTFINYNFITGFIRSFLDGSFLGIPKL